MCGAAALAKLVDGVVFDEAENRLLSVDDAIAVARQNLQTGCCSPRTSSADRARARPTSSDTSSRC